MNIIADLLPLQNPNPRLNGARNFRSLRGMPAAGGLHIAGDALLRSDHLGQLTAEDWATLGALGLQTICDLRGQEERSRAPTLTACGRERAGRRRYQKSGGPWQ